MGQKFKRIIAGFAACIMSVSIAITATAAGMENDDDSPYKLETRSDGYTYCINTKTKIEETGMVAFGVDEYYCFDSRGRMVTNKWYTDIEGDSYYFGEDGLALLGGTYRIGSDWYLFDEYGVRFEGGLTKFNGNYYYFSKKDGKRCSGLVQIKGSVYCFDKETGRMVSGWVTLGGKKYYFGNDGKMLTGIKRINGTEYVFGDDGALIG